MSWLGGKRHLKQFSSLEANKTEFKWLWKNHYGNKFPTMKEANRYTGSDRSAAWLENVRAAYNE